MANRRMVNRRKEGERQNRTGKCRRQRALGFILEMVFPLSETRFTRLDEAPLDQLTQTQRSLVLARRTNQINLFLLGAVLKKRRVLARTQFSASVEEPL